MKQKKLWGIAWMVATLALPVFAARSPHPLLSDARVTQVAYDPNQVYEIQGAYGYQTMVEFAAEETIKVVALGDSIAWQPVAYQNRLFLKPVEQNAQTNLTVITDRRTYYFRLGTVPKHAPQPFLVRFRYPEANDLMFPAPAAPAVAAAQPEPGAAGTFDPARINLNYGMAGDKAAIALNRAFDDGEFTYFRFDAGSAIPAVYQVNTDGTEAMVATRREGDYLVVEQTGSLFTLRNGNAHLCVQNNQRPFRKETAGQPVAFAGGRK